MHSAWQRLMPSALTLGMSSLSWTCPVKLSSRAVLTWWVQSLVCGFAAWVGSVAVWLHGYAV